MRLLEQGREVTDLDAVTVDADVVQGEELSDGLLGEEGAEVGADVVRGRE